MTAAPARTSAVQMAVSACFESMETFFTVTSARDGARHEQHGRGAPVPLDAEKGRAVALSALDVELLVVVMADFHAETCRRVDGHVQIGGRDGAADVERGVVLRERERQQQPRDELRRNRAVDVDLPRPGSGRALRRAGNRRCPVPGRRGGAAGRSSCAWGAVAGCPGLRW